MKLKLNELPNAEEKEFLWDISQTWLDRALQADSEHDELEASLFASVEPLKLAVWIFRDETDLFFKATLTGPIRFTCVRCLNEETMPLEFTFSGIFRAHGDYELEILEDPANFFYSNDEIDFSDPLREHLFLNLPLNPVCRDEELCRQNQLLPEEKEQRNSEEETIDPRWEALLKIKKTRFPDPS